MRLITTVLLSLFVTVFGLAQEADVIQIGDPLATTVQLPTFGISFDARGVLQRKTLTDPTGRLTAQRAAAARAALAGNLGHPTRSRKVSIVRLQAAMSELLRGGKPLTDTMRKLAGLTGISSVFCYPELGDIVITGPAEPWAEDLSSRTVGIETGRPTLLLEDLAVALRAYRPKSRHRGLVGCTINPRPEGLAKLVQFQRTIPRSIPQQQRGQIAMQVAQGVKESLGMAEVKVFGVSPSTHFAAVMIEADYRMKRIAIGVEPPPVRLTTFAAAMTTARNGAMERWWFTPAYDGVRASPDRLAMQLTGQGIQLQTENKNVLSDGTIVDAGHQPSKATRVFATSFTKRYSEIAAASPVYAQLRQLTDLLIAAAFLREHDWYGTTGWDPNDLVNEQIYPVNTLHQPMTAPVVVNTFWKRNRMFTPAGGGVSIEAEKAIDAMTEDEGLDAVRAANRPDNDTAAWWWD